MSWTIYCHTHTGSGRRYIGLTKQTMERRWASHVSKSKFSKDGRWHFPNAIRKYGPEAFEHRVLEICETLELANEREDYWIKFYDARNPERGFNLAEGGKHEPHPIRKNPWDDPEYRAKQLKRPNPICSPEARAKNKASLSTPESKAKRSAISRANNAKLEVKEKISEALKKRPVDQGALLKNKLSHNSPEYKMKASTISKAVNARPEVRLKLAAAAAHIKAKNLKRIVSKETKNKLSLAGKGRIMTPETRAKISAAMTGRTGKKLSPERCKQISETNRRRTPETKARLSAALKNAWARKRES